MTVSLSARRWACMGYRVRHLSGHDVDLIPEVEVTSTWSLVADTVGTDVWGSDLTNHLLICLTSRQNRRSLSVFHEVDDHLMMDHKRRQNDVFFSLFQECPPPPKDKGQKISENIENDWFSFTLWGFLRPVHTGTHLDALCSSSVVIWYFRLYILQVVKVLGFISRILKLNKNDIKLLNRFGIICPQSSLSLF